MTCMIDSDLPRTWHPDILTVISALLDYLQVALLLIDEVHLLNENRGAVLEAGVVSRIKMISSLRAMSEVESFFFVTYSTFCQVCGQGFFFDQTKCKKNQ